MAEYLKLFQTDAEYQAYMAGSPLFPNVSYCEDLRHVHFNKGASLHGFAWLQSNFQLENDGDSYYRIIFDKNDTEINETFLTELRTAVVDENYSIGINYNGSPFLVRCESDHVEVPVPYDYIVDTSIYTGDGDSFKVVGEFTNGELTEIRHEKYNAGSR